MVYNLIDCLNVNHGTYNGGVTDVTADFEAPRQSFELPLLSWLPDISTKEAIV